MKKIKIDVVAVPLSGHLYPTLNLVKPLLDDPTMEIRVFTGPQKKAVTESLGFTVVPILEDKVEKFECAANNEKKLNLFSAYRQLSKSLDLINHVSDQLLEEWRVNRPDIVIADFITLSAGFVAEELEIPWITTMATQFAIETPYGPPCFFGGMGVARSKKEEKIQALCRKLTRIGKHCVTFLLRKRLKRYNFKLYNQNGVETIYSPYAIFGIGMMELELKTHFPHQYAWLGPLGTSLEKAEDYPLDLSPYEDKKKILVTCGTQLPWAKENLLQQTKQLAKKHPECHFFVTLGDGAKDFSEEEVAPNVTVVSYLPYKEYIPQMDYVIHHGGAGIFYQCIEFKKPALILPHDYDQFDYAIRGVEAGIAFQAHRNRTEEIQAGFNALLEKESWEELARLNKLSKTYKPLDTLEFEIQRLLRRGTDGKL